MMEKLVDNKFLNNLNNKKFKQKIKKKRFFVFFHLRNNFIQPSLLDIV